MPLSRKHLALYLILAAYLVLGFVYSFSTPLFEAPDELDHYQFSRFVANTRSLPILSLDRSANVAHQEGGQAPFYYLIGAIVSGLVPARDESFSMTPNPHGGPGYPHDPNKNIWLHDPMENLLGGDFLAARLLRSLSLVLGAIAIVFTYRAALDLWPDHRPISLLASSFVAFNPQFLFISSAINNDALAVAVGSSLLWKILTLIGRHPGRADLVLLGCLAGIGILTKVNMIPIAAVILVGLAFAARWPSRAALARGLAMVVGLAVLLAGWWYARNWLLYGEPFASTISALVVGGGQHATTFSEIIADLDGLKKSFWAVFGAFNIVAEPLLYSLFDVLMVLAAAGLSFRALRREHPLARLAGPVVLVGWTAICLLALVRWRLLVLGFQGRLLFPALPPIALLLSAGLLACLPEKRRKVGAVASMALLAAVAAIIPGRYLLPAYAAPSPSTPSQLANLEHPLNVTFGDALRLVGFTHSAAPSSGARFDFNMYWQAVRPLGENYSVVIRLTAPDGTLLGKLDTYPASTMFPTSNWPVGPVFPGTYQVNLAPNIRNVAVALLDIGVYSLPSWQRLVAHDSQTGAALGDTVNLRKFPFASQWDVPAAQTETIAVYGDSIALATFTLGHRELRANSTLEGDLYWRVIREPRIAYTTFAQILGPKGVVAQFDGLAGTAHYSSDRWSPQEIIRDKFRIAVGTGIAPGKYNLIVGLYDLKTAKRLPSGSSDYIVLDIVTLMEN